MTAEDVRFRRRLLLSIAAVALIALGGTLGFHYIEGWSLLDSFYMVVITLTTIGFGLIDELSTAGTVFTIVLIVLGVGAAAQAVAAIAEYIVEGHLAGSVKRRRLERMIARLQGHYIVCGFGRMGQGIVNELLRAGESVCVIEADPQRFALLETLGVPVVLGDATQDRTLIAAGISRAKGLVAALHSDAENAFATLSGRSLAPAIKIVARAESESSLDKLRQVGADYSITPYGAGAQQMTFLLTKPLVAQVMAMLSDELRGEMVLRQIEILPDSPLAGMPIGKLETMGAAIDVLALKRSDKAIRCLPGSDEALAPGDMIVVVGAPGDLNQLAATRRPGAG